jgi:hypothetical protein
MQAGSQERRHRFVDHAVAAGFARRINPRRNGVKPGPAILVRERDAGKHWTHVQVGLVLRRAS